MGNFAQKKWPFLTTNVSAPVEQNLSVKHPHFIADSERAWKVDLIFLIGAEQTGFKSYLKFGQKWTIIEMVNIPLYWPKMV